MQSGIKASPDLLTSFQTLLTTPTHRGLLVHISATRPESLIPGPFIPSKSPSFTSDLPQLEALLSDTEAAYILLRQDGKVGEEKAAGDYVAVTYVPDGARVRAKMLFASTRLTLVRELGIEHFSTTLFATNKSDLSPAGWEKHLAHVALEAPMTEEERSLVGIREAEAQESMGTSARRGGHVTRQGGLNVDGKVEEAVKGLVGGELGAVVLEIDLKTETLHLTSTHPPPFPPSSLSKTITPTSPRYTLISTPEQGKIIFISTVPPSSSIKEKMIYASSRNSVLSSTLPALGVSVAGRIEAGGVEDIMEEEVLSAAGEGSASGGNGSVSAGAGVGGTGEGRGFSRPKRPGRR